MAQSNSASKKELKGIHVLFMLFAFFGVMLSVNIYFTVMAVTTFSGEDVPRSYRQGLEYNDTIKARTEQRALGWQAAINVADNMIITEITDAAGRRLTDINITATLRHPATLSNDQELIFQLKENGTYAAQVFGLTGQWKVIGQANKADETFRFEADLWLQ